MPLQRAIYCTKLYLSNFKLSLDLLLQVDETVGNFPPMFLTSVGPDNMTSLL